MVSPALHSLLATLAASRIELIVVGGIAAVAQGAPITTHDLDIVPRRTRDNIERLVEVLLTLDARYRGHADIKRPTPEILMGRGHSLLKTTSGPLDVLGEIEEQRDFDVLLPDTIEIDIRGNPVRLLTLQKIVEIKRASTHPKDQRMLPLLEEALRRAPR
jgi:hypothetical protein